MVNRQMQTTTVGCEISQKRTAASEFSGLPRNPSEVERKVIFPQVAETQAKEREEVVNIVLTVNTVLSSKKIPSYVRLQRLIYTKKGNLSKLLKITAHSSLLLPMLRDIILTVVRCIDTDITDILCHQKWHRNRIHRVDLER